MESQKIAEQLVEQWAGSRTTLRSDLASRIAAAIDAAIQEKDAEIERLRDGLQYIGELTGCKCSAVDCPECYAQSVLAAPEAARKGEGEA